MKKVRLNIKENRLDLIHLLKKLILIEFHYLLQAFMLPQKYILTKKLFKADRSFIFAMALQFRK